MRSVEEVCTVFTQPKRLQTEESSVQNTRKSTNTNYHSPPPRLCQNKTCIREGQSSPRIYKTLQTIYKLKQNCGTASIIVRWCSPQHHQDFQQGDRTPDCEEIRRWRREKTVVKLNVGGERHEVGWRLLEGQPRSRLGLLALATTADQVDLSKYFL